MAEYRIEGKNVPTTVDWLRSIASLVIEKHIAAGSRATPGALPDEGSRHAADRLRAQWAVVAPCVRFLSQRQRLVVELRFRDGMCYADIAARLGIPVGTVRSRLARARVVIEDRTRELAGDAGAGSEHAADVHAAHLMDIGPGSPVGATPGQA